MDKDINSVLNMRRLVFDKILFDRNGFKNQNPSKYTIETQFAKDREENIYRITLTLSGEKENEYTFEIILTGFFSFESNSTIDEKIKNELITKNAVAIMMPYMRSQISLLTAQPEVDCVVLPPFNINNLVQDNESENEQFSAFKECSRFFGSISFCVV